MSDARYNVFKERLNALSTEEVKRIQSKIDSICFDTFNFDSETQKFCPLAIGMNLHQTVKNPTNKLIVAEIGKRFNPVNALKGVKGNFYTENRREDLITICEKVLNERSV